MMYYDVDWMCNSKTYRYKEGSRTLPEIHRVQLDVCCNKSTYLYRARMYSHSIQLVSISLLQEFTMLIKDSPLNITKMDKSQNSSPRNTPAYLDCWEGPLFSQGQPKAKLNKVQLPQECQWIISLLLYANMGSADCYVISYFYNYLIFCSL